MKDSYADIFKDVNKVLVVMAHPDDAEITCGGLMARLCKDKKQIKLLITTNGGKGTRTEKGHFENSFGEIRINEQLSAGSVIGLTQDDIFNLGFPDGEIEYAYSNVGKIVYHIRDFKPDLVITHNAEDALIRFSPTLSWVNHHDHRVTGLLTLDACYPYSRDTGFYPNQLDTLEVHEVHKLLLTDAYSKNQKVYVDYTKFKESKKKMLAAHKSQISEEHAKAYLEDDLIDNRYLEIFEYLEIY